MTCPHCGKDESHFVPPMFGEFGGFICDAQKVEVEVAGEPVTKWEWEIEARNQKKRADAAEKQLEEQREWLPRDVVESLLNAKLPCGHPNDCATADPTGTRITCHWCADIVNCRRMAERMETTQVHVTALTATFRDLLDEYWPDYQSEPQHTQQSPWVMCAEKWKKARTLLEKP